MERWISFLHRKFDNYSFEEYCIMCIACTIFLPYYFSVCSIILFLFYLAVKGKLFKSIRIVPKAWFAIIFCLLTSFVAVLYQNYIGAFCGLVILCIMIFTIYYRTIINKRLFELLMDACCIISLFCVIWAIMEYTKIVDQLGLDFFMFEIEDNPKYRVNSTFFNANYYAMMIEFIVLICVYKMMQMKTKRRIIFYTIVIIANLFALYLTGCRTAWIPFVVTIPLMFLMNMRLRFFTISMSTILVGGMSILFHPQLMQRTSIFIDFMKRAKIWKTAIYGIMEHPLFGQGPLTYMHIYKKYHGHPTQHAHSVFLDPLLSHGVILVIVFGIYLFVNIKEHWLLFKRKIDIRLCSLFTAFVLTVLIHGMLDYTIYWIQTAQLFLLVCSASSMYFKQRNER